MMPLQAMSCGTPIITTNYHGPTQYATKANSYLLPVTSMGLAQDTTEAEPVPWAFYDTDELGRLMASVLSPKTRQAKVAAGLTEAAKWTWDRSATRLMQIVQENIGYVHRRPPKWVHPKVTCSVVMPVRNASPKLRTTLDTLYNLKQPDEVFVYDDASSADEAQAIREIAGEYDRCTVLRGEKQVGCHEARRILFEQARGLYIASIDGDMDFAETDPEWQYMLAALLKEHRAGIVHPLLLYTKWHDKYPGMVHSAGSYVKDTKAVFDHRFIREPVTDEAFRPTEVAVCCGAFQFFRADLLNSIVQDGVYWPAYFGDADFAYRARAAGKPVWYCPQVVVGHDANSWGQTEEGKRLANWGETSQRFMERWADMVADDLLRQDETGALR
jgi:GT2 family glycosyltransferase